MYDLYGWTGQVAREVEHFEELVLLCVRMRQLRSNEGRLGGGWGGIDEGDLSNAGEAAQHLRQTQVSPCIRELAA